MLRLVTTQCSKRHKNSERWRKCVVLRVALVLLLSFKAFEPSWTLAIFCERTHDLYVRKRTVFLWEILTIFLWENPRFAYDFFMRKSYDFLWGNSTIFCEKTHVFCERTYDFCVFCEKTAIGRLVCSAGALCSKAKSPCAREWEGRALREGVRRKSLARGSEKQEPQCSSTASLALANLFW